MQTEFIELVKHYWAMSDLYKDRSRCKRLNCKVACVIVKPESRTALGIGVSGPPSYKAECDGMSDPCGCVHAEIDAIARLWLANWNHAISGKKQNAVAIITRAPCVKCAQAIIATRLVCAVVCPKPLRGEAGIQVLIDNAIYVCHVPANEKELDSLAEHVEEYSA